MLTSQDNRAVQVPLSKPIIAAIFGLGLFSLSGCTVSDTLSPAAGVSNSADACLDPSATGDPDIKRNASALRSMKACIRRTNLREGKFNWTIFAIERSGSSGGPLWAVPHDNENSAFDTAVYALSKYGGRIVTLETGERRSFQGQDTNRNFGTTSAVARGCREQAVPAPKFTAAFLSGVSTSAPIIALHTNSNGYSGDGAGGSGTISVNRQSTIMKPFKSASAKGAFADPDNALLIASSRAAGNGGTIDKTVKHFTGNGIHVIAEHVTAQKNDCSLSNYVVLNRRNQYFNIEVQNGQGATQRKILDALMTWLN